MEFTELVKEYNRMCRTIACYECQINNAKLRHELSNEFDYMSKYPEEFAEIVERWSKEHPIKTNGEKLKEIISETFGIPVARLELDGLCANIACDCSEDESCSTCPYYTFWSDEYKEVK